VLGLVASYLGIYFYLRVIQYAFMSPREQAPSAASRAGGTRRRPDLPGSAILLAVPGWVIARL
jgi:NADH-quinone oxidoreductase subunit N